jgi:hypothetical protein
MKGTILAGDGVIIPIMTGANLGGLAKTDYFNRKGCTAVCAQAFCDAWCRFRYFEVRWPGSTNDITAYKQTEMRKWWKNNLIPDCYHMVLDEAYSSIGGDQHLCPFTKHQLRSKRESDEPKYLKMKVIETLCIM